MIGRIKKLNKNIVVVALFFCLMLVSSAYGFGGSSGGGGGNSDVGNLIDDIVDSVIGCDRSEAIRGPSPTVTTLEADVGPYTVETKEVSSFLVDGFGGGTIYYPTDAGDCMGAIAVVPGFLSFGQTIEWWGSRVASWGFVVITIDTEFLIDLPDARAAQLSVALDYVVNQSRSIFSSLFRLVDKNRLGTIGWSMGGGGALTLSTQREIKATIALTPWDLDSDGYETIDTPTFVVACEADLIAPVPLYADPFYEKIPNSTDKLYLGIGSENHFCVTSDSEENHPLLGAVGVAWMKRHLDGDQRFNPILCGINYEVRADVYDFRETCEPLGF